MKHIYPDGSVPNLKKVLSFFSWYFNCLILNNQINYYEWNTLKLWISISAIYITLYKSETNPIRLINSKIKLLKICTKKIATRPICNLLCPNLSILSEVIQEPLATQCSVWLQYCFQFLKISLTNLIHYDYIHICIHMH